MAHYQSGFPEQAKKYILGQLRPVFNGTVVGAAFDDESGYCGLHILSKSGKRVVVWFLMDEEDNGPGWFDVQQDGKQGGGK